MTTKRKYSLRKFKVGVASVLVGIGVATTGAAVALAAEPTEQPVAFQPAVENTDSSETTETPKLEVTNPEIKQAEADVKTAEAKVTEAQAKVDTAIAAADEANTRLEAEKKEAADAEVAKTKAEEAKKAIDTELAKAKEEAAKADYKAKEEIKKEEDAKKEEADSKDALSKALDQLEEATANNPKITNNEVAKKAAKELVDKEGLLKAIESGELKAGDVLKELENDNATADNTSTTPAEPKSKGQLPENIKVGIEKAEKEDAARPRSEKLQDKADDLAEKIEELTAVAEADKDNAEKKAEALKKTRRYIKRS